MTTSLRGRIDGFIHGPRAQGVITGVILFNALILGLETWPRVMAAVGPLLVTLDRVCLAIFVIEIGLKLYARGLRFFRDGWNVFDFIVVGIAVLPATQGLSVLRAMRILRLLRIVSVTPRLRRVVEGFLSALPGMASVFLLMGIIFYIFSVMATKLFGATFPEWFGDMGNSAYSLFQIMTLESWSMGISRPVMENFPYAWAFFIPFILVATFTMLNLFIAIIVNAMQDFTTHEQEETVAPIGQLQERLDAEMRGMRDEIRELKALLVARSNLYPISGEPS